MAVSDIAGLAVGHVEAFLDGLAVIHQLVLLSNKILLFKYSHSERSFMLQGKVILIRVVFTTK